MATQPRIPRIQDVPRVLALVLNWNGASDTLDCLESLKRQTYPALDVLVLDNASTDDSVVEIRTARPDVELLQNAANLGYGGGNNVGLRLAMARDIPFALVLNNDTVLEPDCVASLVRAARAHPEAAALAPKSYYFGQPKMLYSAGGTWDPSGYPRLIGFRKPDGAEYDIPRRTDWLNGCALMIRCKSLSTIGLFDERFFHTFEDTDWSLRARHAGFSLRVAPQAHLAHRIGRSLGGSDTPSYAYYYTRNHLLFVALHFHGWQRLRQMLGVFVRARRALKRARKHHPARRSAIRRAMLQALADALLGRFGVDPNLPARAQR